MKLKQQLRSERTLRLVGLVACGLLLFLMGVFLAPPTPTIQTYADEPAPAADPSITINTASTIAANLAPTSSTGNFASASGSFSVTTTNELGYTLKIKSTTNNGTDLKYVVDNNTTYTIPTLGSDITISESAFSNSANTQYNNKWGYKPSKLDGEPNTSYRPAPSADGDTLDVTDAANAEANDYTISLGVRADSSTKAGNYSNTFIIEATANVEVIPAGLRVDFNGNGLLFSNNKATNTLVYDVTTTTETVEGPGAQYITSCNISWDGGNPQINGDYSGCSQGMSGDVFTVPGASYLRVYTAYDTVTDSGAMKDGDIVGIIRGSSMNMSNVVAMYTGQGGMQSPVIATVPGDTAMVGFIINSDSTAREGKMGYVTMIVGYDENDNEITGSTEVETTTREKIYGEYSDPSISNAYTFLGWSTDQNDTSATYTNLSEIEEDFGNGLLGDNGDTVTLYAIYQTNYTIHYVANGNNDVTGGMGDQTEIVVVGNKVTLWAPNYSRSGYGFAGWNTVADGTGTNYGPNETITMNNTELTLYAKWVASADNLQNWTCPNNTNMPIGTVTALTDTRDSQTYAVAKLADGNCWMIENLRLDDSATTLSASNTNQPASGFTALSASSNSWCTQDNSSSCVNQNKLNTVNTNNLSQSVSSSNRSIYAYGNYYSWYAATAGNGTYEVSSGNTAGDICPAGWHLPYGNSGTGTNGGNTSGGFYYLNYKLNNDSNVTDSTASDNLRSYPNNFVYSGFFYNYSARNRGIRGNYWSSTANDSNYADYFYFDSDRAHPGTSSVHKYFGPSVRCVLGS